MRRLSGLPARSSTNFAPQFVLEKVERLRRMSPATKIELPRTQRNLLRAVASFEVIKGLFVLLIGFSAILLVHKDAWVIAESLLAFCTSAPIATQRRSSSILPITLLTPACGRLRNWHLLIPPCASPRVTDCGSSAPGRNGSHLDRELCFFRSRSAHWCGALLFFAPLFS